MLGFPPLLALASESPNEVLHCIDACGDWIVASALLRMQIRHAQWFTTAVTVILDALLVITSFLDATSGELVTKFVLFASVLAAPPLLDNAKHGVTTVSDTILPHIALGGVVENAMDDAVVDAADIDVFVIPCLDNLGDYPLHSCLRDFSSGFIEDVGEVVFAEHRVRGVRGAVIVKHDVLCVLGRLDDLIATGVEFVLDLADDGHDVGCEEGEDEFVDFFLDIVDEVREDGDLLNGLGDTLHDFIVPFDDGFDLILDVVEVAGPFFGLAGRDTRVLHLVGLGVLFEFLHFACFVFAAEDAGGDLVEQVF
jgi:hypothetical protein